MTRSFYHSLGILTLCAGLSLCGTGCSEGEPQQEGNQQLRDAPSTQDALTEPATFRINVDSSLDLPAPPQGMGQNTTIARSPEGKPALYGVESARIVLEAKGDRSGRVEHIFKEYGLYEKKTDSTMPVKDVGANFPQHNIALTTPEFTGSYNYLTQYAWQIPLKYSFPVDSAEEAGLSLGEFAMKKQGGKMLGDTVLNGYHTRVYRLEYPDIVQTFWLWRGVPIRIHFFFPMDDLEFRLEPVSIELNPKFAEGTFAFPKGVPVHKRESPPPPGMVPPPPPEPGPPPSSDTGSRK